jgi:hypothetical protein
MVKITEQAAAAMHEFGFDAVPLDRPGAPTPGRIADRLADVQHELESGLRRGLLARIVRAARRLRRIVMALDAWDYATALHGPNPGDSPEGPAAPA